MLESIIARFYCENSCITYALGASKNLLKKFNMCMRNLLLIYLKYMSLPINIIYVFIYI